MKFSTQKRENAKTRNAKTVFAFLTSFLSFKFFQKREFKNCYFMKFMKLKREFIQMERKRENESQVNLVISL